MHRHDSTYKYRESDDYFDMSPPLDISQNNFYYRLRVLSIKHIITFHAQINLNLIPFLVNLIDTLRMFFALQNLSYNRNHPTC
jgi:hypothetical protein